MPVLAVRGTVAPRRDDHPYAPATLARRLLPFAIAAVVGAVAPLAEGDIGIRWAELIAGAGIVAILSIGTMLLAPWQRLPGWMQLLPPLGYLAVVAMVRAGTDGNTLVYEPLLTLPVFWVALYHSRRQVWAMAAVVAAITAVSAALQHLSAGAWPEVMFWPAAAASLGVTVQSFVERVRHQRAELETLARTDPLTGAGNVRAWHAALDRQLSLAARLGHSVTLAILDLDRFKEWNDDNGHIAGDRLLRDLVASWQTTLREVDLLARLGGDEFGVLLPGSDPIEAEAVVERMRRMVPPPLSCSAGLTSWDAAEDAEDLVDRADRALYIAKQAGRDRTAVLSPEPLVTSVTLDVR